MIQIQVVPRAGYDVYRLLRSRILHQAATWEFANKGKTRIKHVQRNGHLEIASAGGVLVANVVPKDTGDEFYLAEKFIGRIVAWFGDEVSGINVQFMPGGAAVRRRGVKKRR